MQTQTQIATFSSTLCQGKILMNPDGWTLTVQGLSRVTGAKPVLRFMAAAPPDFRQSYMGSGLPFANSAMAYDSTPNKGEVPIASDGAFSFNIVRPNAYYVDNGSRLENPHVQFTIGQELFDVKLGLINMPDRSLTGLPQRPVRTTGR